MYKNVEYRTFKTAKSSSNFTLEICKKWGFYFNFTFFMWKLSC